MPGAEMPPRLGLTIAGAWCPAHLKTISFQLSKITNCFISSKTFPPLFCYINHSAHSCPWPRCGRSWGIADAHLFIYIHLHPETEVRIMEIQFGYRRFSLCHDDFATQIVLDIPLGSVFLHLRHKNLAEIIRNIQNITNFVDGDYDDGRLPTVDSKPFDVQRLCPTAHSSVALAPTASAWSGGATGGGWTWQMA